MFQASLTEFPFLGSEALPVALLLGAQRLNGGVVDAETNGRVPVVQTVLVVL